MKIKNIDLGKSKISKISILIYLLLISMVQADDLDYFGKNIDIRVLDKLSSKSKLLKLDIGKNFSNRSLLDIERDFGKSFSKAFSTLSLGNWQGPISSTYGSHLVKILDKNEEYMPSFEEVISQVRADFLLNQRDMQIKNFVDELKANYQVIISPSFTQ